MMPYRAMLLVRDEPGAGALGGIFGGGMTLWAQATEQPWYVGVAALVASVLAASAAAAIKSFLEKFISGRAVNGPAIDLAIAALQRVRDRGELNDLGLEALLAAEAELERLRKKPLITRR